MTTILDTVPPITITHRTARANSPLPSALPTTAPERIYEQYSYYLQPIRREATDCYLIIILYCSLNVTGIVYRTLTAFPCRLPGIHLGIPATTLIASLSNDGSTDFLTSISDIEPSRSTTNDTMTLP